MDKARKRRKQKWVRKKQTVPIYKQHDCPENSKEATTTSTSTMEHTRTNKWVSEYDTQCQYTIQSHKFITDKVWF